MKGKFDFLVSLKLYECGIRELTNYSKACCECYELLRIKLDELCEFMAREETKRQWTVWERDEEIQLQAKQLREASVTALCDVEKYLSKRVSRQDIGINKYLFTLLDSMKEELQNFGIDSRSRVLFIGSGAFPVSVLILAKEFGAEVVGVDIDSENVLLAGHVAHAYDLESLIGFTDKKLSSLTFLQEITHIIIASLVENKLEVLDQLKNLVKDDVKVMVRYGNGLKSIFNYSLSNDFSSDWLQSKLIERNPIYDSIILKKSSFSFRYNGGTAACPSS